MKKVLFGLFAIAMFAFVACQKESVSNPTVATTTTASRVANTSTEAVTDATPQALTGVDTPQGKPKRIKFDSLPDPVKKAILASIDTSLIKGIVKLTNKKDGTVTYVVVLKDGTRLYFDAEGNKVEPPTPSNGGGGPGGNGGNGGEPTGGPGGNGGGEPATGPCAGTAPVKATVEDLPAAAADYIKANYPTAEIKLVMKITKADCTVYYQVMLKNEKKGKVLLFDEKGNLVKK